MWVPIGEAFVVSKTAMLADVVTLGPGISFVSTYVQACVSEAAFLIHSRALGHCRRRQDWCRCEGRAGCGRLLLLLLPYRSHLARLEDVIREVNAAQVSTNPSRPMGTSYSRKYFILIECVSSSYFSQLRQMSLKF